MDSPARRAFLMLRQHFLLISAPWLTVSALGFAAAHAAREMSNLLLVTPDMRGLRGSGMGRQTALFENLKVSLVHLGVVNCIEVLEIVAKLIALALLVVMVTQVALYEDDTFSAALGRLRSIPALVGNLLRLLAIVVAIGLGSTIVATLPVALMVPLRIASHQSPQFFRWAVWFSASVARLLFVVGVMPFVLNVVWRLQHPSMLDAEAPHELLMPALRLAAAAVAVEAALTLAIGTLRQLLAAAGGFEWIERSLIGLVESLLTALPAIVCLVAISLMALGANEPVTEAAPA